MDRPDKAEDARQNITEKEDGCVGRRMTLKGQISLCLAAFFLALAGQIFLSFYQSGTVLRELDDQMGNFNAISRFQNGVERSLSAMEDYRWEYGDAKALTEELHSAFSVTNAWLWRIESDLGTVSEEQYLLYNAVSTTYDSYTALVDQLEEAVAAGQDIYWRLLVGQQPIPVQRGGGQFDQNFLDYYSIRAVDALEAGRTAFDCGSEWSNAPLWYTSGEAISNVLDELSISSVLTESRVTNVVSAASDSASSGADAVLSLPALLPQEADGKLPDATAPDAVNVRVCFDDDNATGFSYDADSGLYRMLHADGTPQLDANNGQQAGFDNLLVLFSASELRDDGKTYDYDLSMGGGVWLNGGHLWTITWTQGRDNTLLLYDADGRTMNIEAGTSYIALVTSLTGQELTVTNSSGEEILG